MKTNSSSCNLLGEDNYFFESDSDDSSESGSDGDVSDEEEDLETSFAEEGLGERPIELYDQLIFDVNKWYKWYKPQMLTDFVRAAYMLSPHPLVMDHAKKHKDPEDRRAVERLIDKLLLPKDIVDDEVRMNSSAQLMDEFWKEHADFWAKRGNFRDPRIWILAGKDDNQPCQWYQRYVLPYSNCLGKLGCRVLSKVMGIGEAERHWKANKRQLSGQRNRLSPLKTKMQASISAAYCHERSAARRAAANRAGVVWDDDDFETCKFGKYCEGVIAARDKKPVRVFRAWQEKFERTQFTRKGCRLFEAQMAKKYGGLMFRDVDKDGKIAWIMEDRCAVLMRCYKSKDRKTLMEPKQGFGYYYALLVCFDGFDTEKPHEKQPRALWDLFELQGSSDFYEMITEYYEDNDLVNVFQKGECDEYNAKDRSVPFNKCLLEDGTKMGFPEGGSESEEEDDD